MFDDKILLDFSTLMIVMMMIINYNYDDYNNDNNNNNICVPDMSFLMKYEYNR